jgi:DNA invertase Pin-like site-specific DNA recombinase
MKRYVAYFRCSTRKQGQSGLGLEAQREAVKRFIGEDALIAEFEEVESGTRADRPALDAALRECRLRGATLVIAKLDRLSRSVSFISRLMEEGADFVAVDMPSANRFTLHIMAAMAEQEREMISHRTKVALAAARERGVTLGGRRGTFRIEGHSEGGRARSLEVRRGRARTRAVECLAIVDDIRRAGTTSWHGIARELNARCIAAPRGGTWSPAQVSRLPVRAGDVSDLGVTESPESHGLTRADHIASQAPGKAAESGV